jgi:hypothetical protein
VQAWAKHHGCYETVESGQTDDAMAYLTGSATPAVEPPMVGPVPSAGCAYSRERGPRRCCAGAAKAACALAAPWMRCHGCASRRGRAQCESSRRVRSAFELLSLAARV